VAGRRGFLTVKGLSQGARRDEYEYEIPVIDANALLELCIGPVISKTRHRIDADGVTWEVDLFDGANEGLIVAEVELPSEDTDVELPPWVGDEVTADARYFNSNLVEHPYRDWDRS
jgi:adenylate cyclase